MASPVKERYRPRPHPATVAAASSAMTAHASRTWWRVLQRRVGSTVIAAHEGGAGSASTGGDQEHPGVLPGVVLRARGAFCMGGSSNPGVTLGTAARACISAPGPVHDTCNAP